MAIFKVSNGTQEIYDVTPWTRSNEKVNSIYEYRKYISRLIGENDTFMAISGFSCLEQAIKKNLVDRLVLFDLSQPIQIDLIEGDSSDENISKD